MVRCIFVIEDKGYLYGMGDNYKGQLGLGDIRYKHDFKLIDIQQRIQAFGAFYIQTAGSNIVSF
jgi:alpha-tubulin suppressor-like RCC1 family protein